MNLAKKYLLDGLEKECVEYLDDEVSNENVCYILTQALFYENKQLVKTCESFISSNIEEIITSEDFKNLDEKTFCHILQLDSLVIDEMTLFKEVGCLLICEKGDPDPIAIAFNKSPR
jgi:hypothetical protein